MPCFPLLGSRIHFNAVSFATVFVSIALGVCGMMVHRSVSVCNIITSLPLHFDMATQSSGSSHSVSCILIPLLFCKTFIVAVYPDLLLVTSLFVKTQVAFASSFVSCFCVSIEIWDMQARPAARSPGQASAHFGGLGLYSAHMLI